jgi:hypothetical protein
MDPYLEAHWRDVHHGLITYCRDQLQARLPGSLRARMEERVYVESEGEPRRPIGPDVRVIERNPRPVRVVEVEESAGGTGLAVEVTAPVLLEYELEPVHEGLIRIIDLTSDGRVVTVIEFVSPTNKFPGEGRTQYVRKREDCFRGGVNYVEIDLTRAGDRYGSFLPFHVPSELRETYQAWIRRAARPSRIELYPLSLKSRLPAIAVPLRESDRDIPLELQPLVDLCYRNGGFDDIDYARPPKPELSLDDATWSDQLLRSGKR